MSDYSLYYGLWKEIARQFGANGLNCVRIEKNCGEYAVSGVVKAYQPYEDGPPILQFQPNALAHLEEILGAPAVHYEWVLKSGRQDEPGYLDACLHSHFVDPPSNHALWSIPVPHVPPALHGWRFNRYTFQENRFFRKGWTCYRYRWECDAEAVKKNPGGIAEAAARAMDQLIVDTWRYVYKLWGPTGE